MKNFVRTIAILLASAAVGCSVDNQQSELADASASGAVNERTMLRACGTLSPLATPFGGNNEIKITSEKFSWIVIATDAQVLSTINKIATSNASVQGCVHAARLPQQGFEGTYLAAKRIELSSSAEHPLRLCGYVYRKTNGILDEVFVKLSSDLEFPLAPLNQQASATLDMVRWPNDVFVGCVHSAQLAVQGFEGSYIPTEKVDLLGQTTGFSTSNQ